MVHDNMDVSYALCMTVFRYNAVNVEAGWVE